jgi:hypothetical protein
LVRCAGGEALRMALRMVRKATAYLWVSAASTL